MITVVTYIKSARHELVPLELADWNSVDDLDLLEGAIELVVDEVVLLSKHEWDYLHPLWVYMTEALQRYQARGIGMLQYPDQPLELHLRRAAGGVNLQLRGGDIERHVVADEPRFLQAVRARAAHFFNAAASRFPRYEGLTERRRVLLEEGDTQPESTAHWERRLDPRQVAAFRQAERINGRKMTAPEREFIVSEVAGRPGTFDEHLALILKEWGK